MPHIHREKRIKMNLIAGGAEIIGSHFADKLTSRGYPIGFLNTLSSQSSSGEVFNICGGPSNTTSLFELLRPIGELCGQTSEVRFDAWRPADQLYYIPDTCKSQSAAGCQPKRSLAGRSISFRSARIVSLSINSPVL